ncbi:MAG: lactate utilization protein [Prevotella sp.]|nr:lactate utilization protein [Prevotella sp.]MCI7018161.1 lactate utilization protein [Prevotella sp.]MDY3253253.1 lactate utilization protein [Prevotella sp.]MDY4629940.1 lactate utilization protein [Prevotella sp.]
MSPIEIRNEKAAGKVIKNLARRNIEACYCPTAHEAVEKLLEMIPAGSSVTWGGSMSIRDIDIPAALANAGKYKVYDRDKAPDRAAATEIYLKAFSCDYYLSSANAITEDGVIVNIDGTGNRVAAITFGPRNVIFVIGMNKLTQNVDAALARARSLAAPVNTARFDIQTPCKLDGVCHNCLSDDCICNYIHYLRHSPKGKHKVILVGESLGY